ncbi:U1 snRNP-associated protein [Blumeria hordei DH14]|uniref:U1 snRNP-associated protein n=1 Tax=Blumeria graminis f. sp. hordei (strain DH14) TaxID=546991 RepID=N1JBQ6_BLUG1|nr:U1 snRNP-associated protein [Blumeria hordei DH14]
MAYNSYGDLVPAVPYGHPPGFGSFSAQTGAPTGMGPPPGIGMSAPGTAPPLGTQHVNIAPSNRPNGLPASFQGPTNMPNINFSAPVIRLGTGPMKQNTQLSGAGGQSQESKSAGIRSGLGIDRGVEAQRQALMSLIPPTKEEIVRTIFIGGITEGVGDEGIERILSMVGRLRRWDRATEADGKPCSFGFAQYDDPESLSTAVNILKDVEIPLKKQSAKDGAHTENDMAKIEKGSLLVFVDDNSWEYLKNWEAHGRDEAAVKARLDSARVALKVAIHELFNPPKFVKSDETGDPHTIQESDHTDNVEVVNIPLAMDDELADIPVEMRETVAQEIAAFRDRSNRRDMERLKREEDSEALERQRNGASRTSRLSSPGPKVPNGPAAGTNNIPLGPRGIPKAPSGPKITSQAPRDYQRNIPFVNVSGVNGAISGGVWADCEDEDDPASDEELERRRKAKRESELEKHFLDQERRWLNRERSRTAAVQREKEREEEDELKEKSEREKLSQRLREWNDDVESTRKIEGYYADRSIWIRNRAAFRAREAAADERDRLNEHQESEQESADKEQAHNTNRSPVPRVPEELKSRPELGKIQQPFKLSLGAAAQKILKEKAAPPRRTVAEVEGLLEDEEDVDKVSKRILVPIKFDPALNSSSNLTDEERDQAIRQLASRIPTEKEGLWNWEIKWNLVDDSVIVEKLRPFIEKKIVEYLGVQEQLLVEVVEGHIRERGKPQDLVEQLEGALDDEAEVLVKKLWRMVVFYSESEAKGLTA